MNSTTLWGERCSRSNASTTQCTPALNDDDSRDGSADDFEVAYAELEKITRPVLLSNLYELRRYERARQAGSHLLNEGNCLLTIRCSACQAFRSYLRCVLMCRLGLYVVMSGFLGLECGQTAKVWEHDSVNGLLLHDGAPA